MLSNGDDFFFLGRYVGIRICCSIYGFTCFLLLKHFGLLHINSLLKKKKSLYMLWISWNCWCFVKFVEDTSIFELYCVCKISKKWHNIIHLVCLSVTLRCIRWGCRMHFIINITDIIWYFLNLLWVYMSS